MDEVQRVVIRDTQSLLGPDVFGRPLNRLAIGLAALSLAAQSAALTQVLKGHGRALAWPDHVGFATVALLWWALGLVVFLQRRAKQAGQLFLIFAATGSAGLSFGSLYGAGEGDALVLAGGLLVSLAALVLFVRAYTELRALGAGEAAIFVPALLLAWPGAHELAAQQTGTWWKLCLAAMTGYLVLAIALAGRDLLVARSPARAAQSRALLFGLVAGSLPATVLFVAPLELTGSLVVGTSFLPPIILLFLIPMGYAALLFELSASDLIVRRGLVYGVLTLIMIAGYGTLGILLNVTRTSVTGLAGSLGFVAVSIAIGAAFGPAQRLARRFVDWLFYGRSADRWTTLQRLSASLESVMRPDDLARVLVEEVRHALQVEGAFMLRRDASDHFVLSYASRTPGPLAREIPAPDLRIAEDSIRRALGDPPSSLLLIHAKPLAPRYRTPAPERYRVLDRLRVALAVPLIIRSEVHAVLCVQPKLAHDAFGPDDLELLAPIMRQARSALDNAFLFAALQERVSELRALYRRLAHEQEAERARLARELHDGTAQELAALITLATVADRQVGADGPARDTLRRLKHQVEEAYREVRRTSHALRPAVLDDFGLVPALCRFLDELEQTTGLQIERSIEEIGDADGDVELALLRVVQESMENARKHSGATRVRVSLERSRGIIRLEVEDNGRGAGSSTERGIGLASMRERIQGVGGRLSTEGVPHMRIVAVVPADVQPGPPVPGTEAVVPAGAEE